MINFPFKFKNNRVWRVYTGGKMIDTMRGEIEALDGEYPEDWVASVVKANNPQRNLKKEGISTAFIDGKEILFDSLCAEYPEKLLGRKHVATFGASPGFLTKILDSAIRLPIQAHPDNDTARRLYNSEYGKTESWLVLGTRKINGEDPYLMFGFNDNFDKEIFMREALNGKMKQSFSMLHRHSVKPGDTFLIRGGMPHAIGPGVFLIEIMEPTDLVVQPELYCGTQKLAFDERFNGIVPEKAMEVFHYEKISKDKAWEQAFIEPTVVDPELSLLVDRDKIRYFGVKKLKFEGSYLYKNTEGCCAAGIVCDGEMSINCKEKSCLKLKKGDTFFLSAILNEYIFQGNGEIILALPPVS